MPRPLTTPATAEPTTTTSVTTTTTTTIPTTATPSFPTTSVAPEPPRALVHACPDPGFTPPPIDGDPVTASSILAHAVICSSTDVVVAEPDGDLLPSRVAAAIGAPLVYADRDRPYDPAPLEVARVWTADPALVVAGAHAILPLPEQETPVPTLVASAGSEEIEGEVVLRHLESSEPAATLLVVSSRRPDLAGPAAAAAGAVGGTAVWIQPGDMRRRASLGPLARESSTRFLVGDFAGASAWQLDVLATGTELPGGGQVLFPGKRLVALYGHPHTPELGALGEQPVDQAIERAAELAAPYGTDDVVLVPTFEIIATTASSSPGSDGDYSTELSVSEIRPWVEAAGEAGYYVVLDLQPGRGDFLTQARRYEELLKLPHVGLALDPEWRLRDDQIHLRQIGAVSGTEVNTVVGWLAELVRRERLPQKLLVVHQFKLSMITERSVIQAPSELAVVIQMDGQGSLGTKYDTWGAILLDASERWHWGWKNFFDEDSPMATPTQVLDLDPGPVFISYQ